MAVWVSARTLCATSTPAEQARIVALLVERVDIGADGLNVRLRVDGLSPASRANCRLVKRERLHDPRHAGS